MSYSIDLRERVIAYRASGHTLENTAQTFRVSIPTIREWEKRMREQGDLKPSPLHRPFKKIDPVKLREYVALHPDAYQSEMAQEFGCTATSIRRALERENITRKKRQPGIGNKTLKR